MSSAAGGGASFRLEVVLWKFRRVSAVEMAVDVGLKCDMYGFMDAIFVDEGCCDRTDAILPIDDLVDVMRRHAPIATLSKMDAMILF